MSKEVDINNEEEILKNCDFDYYYNSEECSRELCRFYSNLAITNKYNFNYKQANIDLGRIAITLNKQHKRIAELEEQLKNAIVPKFKVGQEIWCIRFMKIIKFKINKIEIYRGESEEENRILYGNWEDMTYQIEENCFATREESQAKLEELKGGAE